MERLVVAEVCISVYVATQLVAEVAISVYVVTQLVTHGRDQSVLDDDTVYVFWIDHWILCGLVHQVIRCT